MFLQKFKAIDRPLKVSCASTHIMGFGARPINGDLHAIAPARRGNKLCHFIGDQRAVGKDRESHSIAHNTLDEFFDVLPHKGLPTLQAYVHDHGTIQHLEEPEPFFRGKILCDFRCTGKVTAIFTTKIAFASYEQIHGSGCFHKRHD
jgi:hypothetical protein